MKAWSIGWKLTAWYIVALSVILLVFGGSMSAMMSRQLHRKIDADLREEARELAQEIGETISLEEFRSTFRRRYSEHGGYSFQICRIDGSVICGNPWLLAHPLTSLISSETPSGETAQDVRLSQLGLHRVLTRRISGSVDNLVIQVVVPYAPMQRAFREFNCILLVSGCLALVAACLGGLGIARHALAPLEKIIHAAERISAENLEMSISVQNPGDELGRLAATLNETFGRLRRSVQRIEQFTADAAHELRTPLSVMRTRLEIALRLPPDDEQFRDSFRTAMEQADKLGALIDQLLLLYRHDSGTAMVSIDEVYLKPLLQDVVEILQHSAVKGGITLALGAIPDCVVYGDDISLSRALFNLLDNAIKYTPRGGRVEITSFCDECQVRLSIADTGVGIDSTHLPKVFDRFYRVDPSRSADTGGVGLGLAICRSIVDSHHGEISVSSVVGTGSTFTLTLPLVSEFANVDDFKEGRHAHERCRFAVSSQ